MWSFWQNSLSGFSPRTSLASLPCALLGASEPRGRGLELISLWEECQRICSPFPQQRGPLGTHSSDALCRKAGGWGSTSLYSQEYQAWRHLDSLSPIPDYLDGMERWFCASRYYTNICRMFWVSCLKSIIFSAIPSIRVLGDFHFDSKQCFLFNGRGRETTVFSVWIVLQWALGLFILHLLKIWNWHKNSGPGMAGLWTLSLSPLVTVQAPSASLTSHTMGTSAHKRFRNQFKVTEKLAHL